MFGEKLKNNSWFDKKICYVFLILFFGLKIFADVTCSVCNEINPEGSKFCGFCGAPIETLKLEKKIDFSKELIEYARKEEFVLVKQDKTSLLLGLVGVFVGVGISMYGFSREEITKVAIEYSSEIQSLNNINIDGYYYPKGNFEIINKGNSELKNFIVKVKFYDNTNSLIKTEYVNLPVNVAPGMSVLHTVETDTGKSIVFTTEVEILDYQSEKVYKLRNESLGWGGVLVFSFGLYNLLRYYNQTVSVERYISYYQNHLHDRFDIVIIPGNLSFAVRYKFY